MTDGPNDRTGADPTKDQPLNGPRRPRLTPVLWLLGLIVVLVALYYFGVNVLIPAD